MDSNERGYYLGYLHGKLTILINKLEKAQNSIVLKNNENFVACKNKAVELYAKSNDIRDKAYLDMSFDHVSDKEAFDMYTTFCDVSTTLNMIMLETYSCGTSADGPNSFFD